MILGIPTGYLISWLARDELKDGRKWFRILIILAVIIGGWFALTGNYVIALTSGFIFIVSIISYMKSYDKKWVKRMV